MLRMQVFPADRCRRQIREKVPGESLTCLHTGRMGWSQGKFMPRTGVRSLASSVPVCGLESIGEVGGLVSRILSRFAGSFFLLFPFHPINFIPLTPQCVRVLNSSCSCDKNPVLAALRSKASHHSLQLSRREKAVMDSRVQKNYH